MTSSLNKQSTVVAEDEVILLGVIRPVKFVIPGNPQALPRSRKGKYGWYNPASGRIKSLRAYLKSMAPDVYFGKEVPVAVTINFYLRRPDRDFVGGSRGGSLKSKSAYSPNGPDIDNLAKYILDALTGIIFYDDKQVVKLVAYKMRDSKGFCEGMTEVEVSPWR